MSFGNVADMSALGALKAGKVGNATSKNATADANVQAAFEAQMRMTQSLFGEGSQQNGEGSSPAGFDTSFVNDAMMFDALNTIASLMRQEAGASRFDRVPTAGKPQTSVSSINSATTSSPLASIGTLSAQFESGSAGVGAIGYDRVGGTSYGKYQIASKPGTMDRFLRYLDQNAPEWGTMLRESGSANTGSKSGAMPEMWQKIAAQDPAKFERIQHDFIAGETYRPARNMILKQTGLDFDNAPPALREVLWSTSVQHGPTGASKIFGRVIDQFVGKAQGTEFNAKLIEGVYDTRKGQFGSSSQRVQKSVAHRLNQEKQLALNMLGTSQINQVV